MNKTEFPMTDDRCIGKFNHKLEYQLIPNTLKSGINGFFGSISLNYQYQSISVIKIKNFKTVPKQITN